VNVAVEVPVLYVIKPATAVLPGPVNVKVVGVMVDEFIGWLNVAVRALLMFTPVAPSMGTVVVTVGTGGVVVVKLHV
jgi:hypothetical protein